MTVAKRLAALESKLIPQPDTYKPVNMRPVLAGLQVAIIAGHDGRKRKNELELVAFARAMRCSPAKLFELAYRDQKRFRARLLPLLPTRPAELADDVACEVVREFLVEELTWQLIELAQAVGWKPPARMPLCSARPCRPAGYVAPTAADFLALE